MENVFIRFTRTSKNCQNVLKKVRMCAKDRTCVVTNENLSSFLDKFVDCSIS